MGRQLATAAEGWQLRLSKECCIESDVVAPGGRLIACMGRPVQQGRSSVSKWQLMSDHVVSQLQPLLQANYGQDEEQAVQQVKRLYTEMELEPLFKNFEQESHSSLLRKIDEQTVLPKEVFSLLLAKIFKRTK